ncbi:MAG: Eco57I restriction-modification methylase domain-containing protein [Dysgonomonas sp.]
MAICGAVYGVLGISTHPNKKRRHKSPQIHCRDKAKLNQNKADRHLSFIFTVRASSPHPLINKQFNKFYRPMLPVHLVSYPLYTYFDIRNYDKILRNADKEDDKKLISLYKFLSPIHLLKLPFANDYNQLNKEFYAELLHILGLEEIKEKSQKLIVRKSKEKRDNGSIIENAINELDSMDKLSRLPNISQYGDTYEERLFNVALDLSITWINRVLFLKLLESQIIKYHDNDKAYSFLTADKIEGYDDLNSLFFQILARKEKDRREGILKDRFAHVPYLNSSLFEQTELEAYTIAISNLRDKASVSLYSKSVLKGKVGNIKELNPLDYLLRFLDAYDFSSEGSEDIQEENKTLISASVLGLIFEKINGYKDGSFFTPSFITMFMCHDTITRTVVQKFNEIKGWECKSINDLYNKISDIKEANKIFNSLKICDMAVGSGHYLVSCLNEMIALKSELGILADRDGRRLKDYKITIENDELIISDIEFGIFKYTPHNHESQRVQETLFHEKQTIIENCLFGVDINPNSVRICQLRLWIELLKHTYYKSGTKELETLPNIDINIKCGNSLIHRFSLDEDLKPALKTIGYTVADYQKTIADYHDAHDKAQKHELNELLSKIKKGLRVEVGKNDKIVRTLQKWKKDLSDLTAPDLFELSDKEKKALQKKITEAQKNIDKCNTIIDEIKNNKNFQNALEWRFEFPEVLDDEGNFVGFDAIIGNPPYIQLQSLGEITDVYKQMNYQTFERTGDIYCLFYEMGNNLLRPDHYLSFITSNKWMRAGYGESMRRYFVDETNPILLIDFAGMKVFDEATVDVSIMTFQKSENQHNTETCQIKDYNSDTIKLSDYLRQHVINSSFGESSITSFVILSDIEKRIKEKIERIGTPLKDWDINIYRGILTGYNEAFIIDGKTKDELIEKSPKNAEIIRPILRGRDIKRYGYEFADLWLICTFPSLKIDIEDYPAIKEHLLSFGYDRLKQTGESGARKKTNNKWFETQDSISYWDDFSKQKIVWKRVGSILRFGIDYDKCVTLDSTCFATGKHLRYLTGVLNSKLGNYMLQDSPKTGTGDLLISVQAIEPIRIPYPNLEYEKDISNIVEKLIEEENNIEYNKLLDSQVYSLYSLDNKEIGFIESQYNQ